ncbi:class I tRNA ligase family protein [Nonomuraea sp. NPDC050404]|uniref:class I tRNA ligase family protein n=1 Tax=Nonomuraea sp. NPDC050404 TaxID=3155783 RepID=UPI0033F66740
MSRPVLIVSPPPTPNGPLHVGHLSGPYVAADAAARVARDRGEDVLTVCGVDDHQNYVPAKARGTDEPAGDLAVREGARIREAFARLGVSHDLFTRPLADAAYRDAVVALLAELEERSVVRRVARPVLTCCGRILHHAYVSGKCPWCGAGMGAGTCEECGGYADPADLAAPVCTACGGTPGRKRQSVLVFPVEEHRDALVRTWLTAALPARVRALIAAYRERPLPELPVAYPTDWGVSTGRGDRVDVWFEMGLAYLVAVARHLDPAGRCLRDYVGAWQEVGGLWPFLGVDNAFYYAVLFPALFSAAGVPPSAGLRGMSVNEFYLLSGEKFSTSRGHAVWALDLLDGADPAVVRWFLLWDRPAPGAADFTPERFAAFDRRWSPLLSRAGSAGGPHAELERARHALRLTGFDAPLATRCLMSAAEDSHREAARLLRLLCLPELP